MQCQPGAQCMGGSMSVVVVEATEVMGEFNMLAMSFEESMVLELVVS